MKIRTNAQLIAELQKHPADALVVFHDIEGDSVCLGDITMDGTCGDGSPEQPYECLRISLTEDPEEEFESLPVEQVEPNSDAATGCADDAISREVVDEIRKEARDGK